MNILLVVIENVLIKAFKNLHNWSILKLFNFNVRRYLIAIHDRYIAYILNNIVYKVSNIFPILFKYDLSSWYLSTLKFARFMYIFTGLTSIMISTTLGNLNVCKTNFYSIQNNRSITDTIGFSTNEEICLHYRETKAMKPEQNNRLWYFNAWYY